MQNLKLQADCPQEHALHGWEHGGSLSGWWWEMARGGGLRKRMAVSLGCRVRRAEFTSRLYSSPATWSLWFTLSSSVIWGSQWLLPVIVMRNKCDHGCKALNRNLAYGQLSVSDCIKITAFLFHSTLAWPFIFWLTPSLTPTCLCVLPAGILDPVLTSRSCMSLS